MTKRYCALISQPCARGRAPVLWLAGGKDGGKRYYWLAVQVGLKVRKLWKWRVWGTAHWLAVLSQVNSILSSNWLVRITWLKHCIVIGWERCWRLFDSWYSLLPCLNVYLQCYNLTSITSTHCHTVTLSQPLKLMYHCFLIWWLLYNTLDKHLIWGNFLWSSDITTEVSSVTMVTMYV